MSDCKVYNNLCKLRCINHLHRLVVYHFREPTGNDKNRIVTDALLTMSKYWEQLQVSIIVPGNKFSSFLDAKVLGVYLQAEVAEGKRAFRG